MKRPLNTLALLILIGAALAAAAGITVGGMDNMVEWFTIGIGAAVILWSVLLIVALSAARRRSREDGP